MARHPYSRQGNGGYIGPNVFHMGMPFPTMPTPFMPVTGPVTVPPYPANVGGFGNVVPVWKEKGSRRHSGDRIHRRIPPEVRQYRGRGGKLRGERGMRLAIFLEYSKCNFQLVESDLRELFSYFGGTSTVAIKPEIAAAEVTLPDGAAAGDAIEELDGIVIPGVGILRCVELKRGDTLNYLLSKSRLYEKQHSSKSHSNRMSYEDSRPSQVEREEGNRRLSRFELVELFTYEPEFDVASQILGPDNANIAYIMKNADGKVDITITGKPLNSAPIAERLHVSLSSNDIVAYAKSMEMIEELLTTVCENFVEYVQSRGKPVSPLVGFGRHDYQEVNGVLQYLGVTEKPRTWLHKRTNDAAQKAKQLFSPPPYRKVSDRSRGISRSHVSSKSNIRSIK